MALVDTGARRSCVTEALAQRAGLQRIGRVEVWNIKRPESHWTYLFNVAIWPDAVAGDPPSPFDIEAEIKGIDVANHSYFDMLMGMDIISQGRLLIDRDGTFELEF